MLKRQVGAQGTRRGACMARGDHYENLATQCLRIARDTANATHKALLLEMALTWIRLAELARESDVDWAPAKADQT